ncbi:hypothetical protein Ct61P_14516 [Colletotrichum tofieldiae]|nr:hypothetical protein Ct61P_14516 [Colletotrichum tofieldiae]
MISLQVKLVVLLLASQASAVQFPLGSLGRSKYTLDAIRPLTDPDTGRTKCCPKEPSLTATTASSGPQVPARDSPQEWPLHLHHQALMRGWKARGQCFRHHSTGNLPSPLEFRDKASIYEHRPKCPPSFELDGKVSREVPVCAQSHLSNGTCISSVVSACPQGSTLDGGTCIKGDPSCPKSHVLHKDACLVGGSCQNAEEETCPPSYVRKNGDCISDEKPICGSGTHFNGTICLGRIPDCKPGTEFDGVQCRAIEESVCPPHLKFNGNHCVFKEAPDCAPLTVRDAASKECVGEEKPACPRGQKFNGVYCALETGDRMEFEYCPPGNNILITSTLWGFSEKK